jgi:hypothetical protein
MLCFWCRFDEKLAVIQAMLNRYKEEQAEEEEEARGGSRRPQATSPGRSKSGRRGRYKER